MVNREGERPIDADDTQIRGPEVPEQHKPQEQEPHEDDHEYLDRLLGQAAKQATELFGTGANGLLAKLRGAADANVTSDSLTFEPIVGAKPAQKPAAEHNANGSVLPEATAIFDLLLRAKGDTTTPLEGTKPFEPAKPEWLPVSPIDSLPSVVSTKPGDGQPQAPRSIPGGPDIPVPVLPLPPLYPGETRPVPADAEPNLLLPPRPDTPVPVLPAAFASPAEIAVAPNAVAPASSRVELREPGEGNVPTPEGGADARDGADKPAAKAAVELTPQELVLQQLQTLLALKLMTKQLRIPGKENDAAIDALQQQLRKEQSGEDNGGKPQWGPASKQVFKAYKEYLETQGVRSAMQDLATMQIGTATRSPEQLRLVNQYGNMLPEQPIDFVNRMRRGELDWKLRTTDNKGKAVDVDTDKPPTQDVLDRVRGAESFVKWAQDEVVFDRRIRLQEHRLEDRIKNEGWPKEWLEHPLKESDRFGWCRAVMERIEESNRVSRMLEAIYHIRTKPGMEKFGEDALKSLPKHIQCNVSKGADDKDHVTSVKLEHPKDLDMQNPDWTRLRKAEQDWLKTNAKQVRQALNAYEFKEASPNNFLFQGDIETRGLRVMLDKKTNEVLSTFKKEDWDDPRKREKLLPPGKKESDVRIEDFNIIQCRLEVGKERGASGELKEITVRFNSQYGDAPTLNYHNLWVIPVGKPANPSAPEWADGKLHFKPTDWVVARSAGGEELPMQAKDLESYKDWEDFKRYAEIGVSAVMDASMVVGGVGAIAQGVKVARGASAMYNALRATQEGMQLVRAGMSMGAIERAGAKMVLKGGLETVLGVTGAVRNDQVQQARSAYFLAQAFGGLPGLSHGVSGLGKLVGVGRDAERLKAAQDLLGIKPAGLSHLLESSAEVGFKWSNRAFAGIMYEQGKEQARLIASIGKPDGFKMAEERLRGVRLDDKPLTPERRRERQEQYLRTVEKLLEDYLKSQNLQNKDDVQKILTKTKALLQPIPKELIGPPIKEKELKDFEEKRKKDREDFLKDLRENFLFDPKRISDLEKQRAEQTPVGSRSSYDKLKDNPVLIDSVTLEKSRVTDAQTAMDNKKAEFKAAGEPKNDEEKHQREEDLLKLRLQLQNAQEKLKQAEETARQQLRRVELDDPKLTGATPERKFQDKDDVRKAAALAYLLLSTDQSGNLPENGVLHKQEITVPGWEVKKSWVEGSGDDAHTVEETLRIPARKIEQQLKVEDLAALLIPDLALKDLGGKDNPASRRLNTAEFLDRLGIIGAEAHASTAKRVLTDDKASPAEKNRAIGDLAALIKQIQLDEARRASGVPLAQRFMESGERFGNTSADLKKVLDDVARNGKENNDVRAYASYFSNYVLNRKTLPLDAAEQDFLKKVVEKEPPGLSYADYMKYMKAQGGFANGDQPAVELGNNDHAGWDRRLRAVQALDQFIDPKTGRAPGDANFTRADINERIAKCIDPSRPHLSIQAFHMLLDKVKLPDGNEKTRLQMLDKDNPELSIKVRENLIKILQDGRLTGNATIDYAIRAAAMDMLPAFMKASSELPDGQKTKLDALRQDAATTLRGALYVSSDQEVIDLRQQLASARQANKPASELDSIRAKLDVAVKEFSVLNGYGSKLTDDQAYKLALQHTLAGLRDGDPKKASLQTAFNAIKDTTTVPAPDKANLVGLNNAAFGEESMRYGAIQALANLGASDPETIRVLRERSAPPKDDNDTNPRVEPDPEVRMAAVRAMQKLMTPFDFSRECNSLLLKERNPAIATILRENSFYSDIALDPQSPQYQDRMAQARQWLEIGQAGNDKGRVKNIEGATSIFEKQIESGSYQWLLGSALRNKMIQAKDGVYGGYWWFFKDLAAASDNGAFDMNWAPGTPPPPRFDANKKELKALQEAISKYNQDLKTKILDVATSTGAGDSDKAKRLEAQKICYALALGKLDSSFSEVDNKVAEAGQTREKRALGKEMAAGVRYKAAKALADACEPGMPNRDVAGKYLMDALMVTDDPTIRRALLKGAENLTKTKYKDGNQEKEDRTLASAAPLVARQVALALERSLSGFTDPQKNRQNETFLYECVQFIRRHSSPDEMRQMMPVLDGMAKADGATPSPIRQALLQVIADKRDRIVPVWNRAPEDTVNRDPAYRKTLLDQALAESRPGAQGNGAEAEMRIPSSVGKIAIATKGEKFQKDDPRVAPLLELLTKGSGDKPRDERIRLAASWALLRQTNDEGLHREAIKCLIDVAVNGNRPGARLDAKSILDRCGGDHMAMAEKALRETNAGEPEQQMKEAQRLSLLGQILAKQGKNDEAERVLTAAVNGFRNKEKDAPLTDLSKSLTDFKKEFQRFLEPAQAERLRDVLGALTELGKIKAGKGENAISYYTDRLRYLGMGWNHPDVIASNKELGDKTYAAAMKQQQGRRFDSLETAIAHYELAWRGMNSSYGSPRDRTRVLDNMGAALVESSQQERPLRMSFGDTPPAAMRTKMADLNYAESAFKYSIDYKEKPGSGFKAADAAFSHIGMATVHEQRAKLDRANAGSHMAKANAEVAKAIELARTQIQQNPIGLADTLRRASEYYKRHNENAKAEALEKEALGIFDKALGKGDLKGKTAQEVETMITDFKEKLGADHPIVGKLLVDASHHAREAGNFVLAEKRGEEAVRLYEKQKPIPETGYKDALLAQGVSIIRQGTGFDRLVEPYTKLQTILEKESDGRRTPALTACYNNLYSGHWHQALKAVKAGDYAKANEEIAKSAEYNKKANGGTLNEYGKDALNKIAFELEKQAVEASKTNDYKTLEATLLSSMQWRKAANDGKLTDKLKDGYGQYARYFESRVADQLKKHKEDADFGDIATPLRLWAEIERGRNGGTMPDQTAGKLMYVLSELNKKQEAIQDASGGELNAEKAAVMQRSVEASLEIRRQLYMHFQQKTKAEPDKAEHKETLEQLEVGIRGQSEALASLSAKTGKPETSATVLEATYRTLLQNKSENASTAFQNLVDIYAQQGKIAELKQLLEKETPILLANDAECVDRILRTLNQRETQSKKPGLTAEATQAVMSGVQKWLADQPANKRNQWLRDHAGNLTDSLNSYVQSIKDFLTDGDGKDLVPAEKAKYEEGVRKLEVSRHAFAEGAERKLREQVAKDPPDEADVIALMSVLTSDMRTTESIDVAEKYLTDGLKNGSIEDPAGSCEALMRGVANDRPANARNAARLLAAVEAHVGSLSKDKADKFIQANYSRIIRSAEMAKAQSELPAEHEARKTVDQRLRSMYEKAEPLWKADLNKSTDANSRRDALENLLTGYMMRGKTNDAKELFKAGVAKAIKDGDLRSATAIAEMVYQSPERLGGLAPTLSEVVDDIAKKAKESTDKSAAAAIFYSLSHICNNAPTNDETLRASFRRRGEEYQRAAQELSRAAASAMGG